MRKIIWLAIGVLFTGVGLAACGAPSPTTKPPVGSPPTAGTTSNAESRAETSVRVAGGSYTNVSPAKLKQMLAAQNALLVNVHIPYAGELEQTDAFIPYTHIEQSISKLPTDKSSTIILYCSSGRMSAIAAETLVKLGYTNVWNLEGGMAAWEQAGYSLVQNKK